MAALAARRLTLGVGESVTGGLVSAAIVDVPGASDVLRGGIVAYANDLKIKLLGVPGELIADPGPVSEAVASAMADGVAQCLGVDIGLATTGEAGPRPQGAMPVGCVFVAAHGPGESRVVERHLLAGDRTQVRWATALTALELGLGLVQDS